MFVPHTFKHHCHHIPCHCLASPSHHTVSKSTIILIIMRYHMIEMHECINKLFCIRRLIYCYYSLTLYTYTYDFITTIACYLLLLIEYFSYLLHNIIIITLAFWIN